MKNRLLFLFCCFALLVSGCGGAATESDGAVPESASAQNQYSVCKAPEAEVQSEAMEEALPETTYGTVTQTEASSAEDAMHYFVFRREVKTVQNENGQDLLWEMMTDPDFYSSDTGLYDWVNGILDEICRSEIAIGQDMLTYAQEDCAEIGEDFYSYSHYFTMGIGRHDSKIVSVLSLSSVYSGGTHPSSVQTACNLDMKEMKVLSLEDVLLPDSAQSLCQMVRSAVEETFSSVGEGLYEDYAFVIENSFVPGNMTPHWYFNETGLVVFFNQYELGPYAAGIIKAVLPYDTLKDVMRPEYFPDAYTGTANDVTVSTEPAQNEDVYCVEFGEGETLYISIDGRASHIQLSEVYFTEGTPVGESMLFSVNYMDESTTFAVKGDWSDAETVYGVEYSDSTVESNVIYATCAEILSNLP